MRLLSFFVALFLMVQSAAANTFSQGTLEIQTESDVLKFQIEIADDEKERSRGLMFRKSLDEMSGMLFIYPEPRVASFWMKNKFLPTTDSLAVLIKPSPSVKDLGKL